VSRAHFEGRKMSIKEVRSGTRSSRSRKLKEEAKSRERMAACCIRQRQIAAKSPDPASTAPAESDSLSDVLFIAERFGLFALSHLELFKMNSVSEKHHRNVSRCKHHFIPHRSSILPLTDCPRSFSAPQLNERSSRCIR
jgi:hypothetical protein